MADAKKPSGSSSSFSSFSSTSTPRSSCAEAAVASTSQGIIDSSPTIPTLMDALPSPKEPDVETLDADTDQHAPSDAPPSDPPPSDPPPSQSHNKPTFHGVQSKVDAWQGDFPPLIDIMRIMSGILEGLMVCPSVMLISSPDWCSHLPEVGVQAFPHLGVHVLY